MKAKVENDIHQAVRDRPHLFLVRYWVVALIWGCFYKRGKRSFWEIILLMMKREIKVPSVFLKWNEMLIHLKATNGLGGGLVGDIFAACTWNVDPGHLHKSLAQQPLFVSPVLGVKEQRKVDPRVSLAKQFQQAPGSGEHSVKWWPCKREDQSSNPGTHIKSSTWPHVSVPVLGRQDSKFTGQTSLQSWVDWVELQSFTERPWQD